MRAILFPGQGAQKVGMGASFYEGSPAARATFDRADRVLGIPLAKICFEGPEEKLAQTDVCQPAILVCSAAIVAAMQEKGAWKREEFAYAAGLSLGEYTALWFAGAIELDDAIRVVRARGEGMQRASAAAQSGMLALLGATDEQAAAVCSKWAAGEVLQPANYLGPGNIAISGSRAALDRVAANARADGIRRAIPLKVAGAFHSPLMEPGVAVLEQALGAIRIAPPRIPVISNVTAKPHDAPGTIATTLLRQVTAPVLWERSMRELIALGVKDFVEPGPGGVLTGLLGKIDPSARCQNVQEPGDPGRAASGTPGSAAGGAS